MGLDSDQRSSRGERRHQAANAGVKSLARRDALRSIIRQLLWCEAALSLTAVIVLVVTLGWPRWIELTVGVDLDHGSGTVECMVAIASVLVALASGALAH